MSTFGGLGIAATGLNAARLALEVTGQNVSNANTEGYSRQRVDQSALAQTALATYSAQHSVGNGVLVSGVSRLTDAVVNARVRSTVATSAYWSTAAGALSSVETSLNEPSTSGLSSTLNDFWASWQTMANAVGTSAAPGAANSLIGQGQLLASSVATGYQAVTDAWGEARRAATSSAALINTTAAQVADLNTTIRALTAAGSNTNALRDQRDAAVTTLSRLTGATTRDNADGTIDVVIGGNAVVSGVTTRAVALSGATDFASVSASPVKLTWADTGGGVSLEGGEMSARLDSLRAADPSGSGTGGVFAEAAKAYNDVATSVAAMVNDVAVQGKTSTGAAGTAFFGFTSPTGPPAANLVVLATSGAQIAVADSTKGNADGSIADRIAQIGASATFTFADSTSATTPGTLWATYVSRIGTQSATATSRSTTADIAAGAATTAQTSVSGVDLDEETANLVLYQHAYQASARVISTINDMLDTLINMGR